MSEGWKIAIVVILITIFVGIIWPNLCWPKIKEIFFVKHPNTIIYIGGYDHSYSENEIKKIAPKRTKITQKPIKFPEGIDSMDFKDVPIIFQEWNYPENVKLFYIRVLNDGEAKDQDIVVDVNFPINETRILSFKIDNNENNVQIIQGGQKGSSRVKFNIRELMPSTSQSIEILTKGKELSEVKAWSGKEEQEINKIFIFDVEIKPDIDYDGPFPLD